MDLYLAFMELDLYQVDAFTSKVFSGNPACVMPLTQWLDDDVMLNLARENAVAETAFLVKNEAGYDLRWFTRTLKWICADTPRSLPRQVLTFLEPGNHEVTFDTMSGQLVISASAALK